MSANLLMARPQKYDDEKLLNAAAEVFLEEGPAARTASIAKRAGVSEGILFKRFKTKEALFEAAMTTGTESNQWREDLLASVGKNTPHDNLKKAILSLFDKLQKLAPKLMILEGRGHQHLLPPGPKAPPLEDAAAIAEYLKKEIKIKRLRIQKPELHAHEIVGAVAHGTVLKLRHQAEVCDFEEWADHLVAVHLVESDATITKTTTRKPRL